MFFHAILRPVALMELIDLTYAYPSAVGGTALRGINLHLEPAEQVSLRGASGSGKSTLLAVMGLLMPQSSGRLIFRDEEVASLPPPRHDELRNLELGFVFQHHFLIPELTAQENVALPAHVKAGRTGADAMDHAARLLDRLGLGEKRNRLPRQVSGGEQQRIAIARALINEPSLILADEPTGNLDSENGRAVLALFREIIDELGCGLVLATHDDHVAEACDRHVYIRDGRLVDEDCGLRSPQGA